MVQEMACGFRMLHVSPEWRNVRMLKRGTGDRKNLVQWLNINFFGICIVRCIWLNCRFFLTGQNGNGTNWRLKIEDESFVTFVWGWVIWVGVGGLFCNWVRVRNTCRRNKVMFCKVGSVGVGVYINVLIVNLGWGWIILGRVGGLFCNWVRVRVTCRCGVGALYCIWILRLFYN